MVVLRDEFYRDPDSRLSQGDIIDNVPQLVMKGPVQALRRASLAGGRTGFESFEWTGDDAATSTTAPSDGFKFKSAQGEWAVASCQVTRGIVLSHGCEIDKPNSKNILIAKVRPLGGLDSEDQARIRENRKHSAFFLPAAPDRQLAESFVDFRFITCVQTELVGEPDRLASLTDQAANALLAMMLLFFTRAETEKIRELLSTRPAD